MKSRIESLSAFPLLVILVCAVLLSTLSASTPEPQPLKATIFQIATQKFCEEKTGYTLIQNLRVHVVNQSDEKLIVQRTTPGYSAYIARDVEMLSKGVYEYHPNSDAVVDLPIPDKPVATAPGTNFAILTPGDSFDGFSDFWVSVRRADLPAKGGTLQPGSYVLQLEVSTWGYRENPEEFRKSWERFGRLIYKPVRTDPIPLNLPPGPKVENCK